MLMKSKNSLSHTAYQFARTFCVAASVSTAVFTSNAAASDTKFLEEKVTVKFSMAELKSENGTAKVYNKLETKAASACAADKRTLNYTGQTLAACTAELMDQFVESANELSLKKLHTEKRVGYKST